MRYTGRKFLLTAVGAFALYSAGQYGEMVVLVLGFVGVEGGADLVKKYQTRTLTASDIGTAVSQNAEYEVDTSKVVTGKPKPTPLFNETEKEEQ